MKYIIDIEDEPLRNGEDAVYKARGFNSLVFDKNGLSKLTPLSKNETEFAVGDEVMYDDGSRVAYVLVPDYRNDDFVLLMEGYAVPQLSRKCHWKKTGAGNKEIIKLVQLAADAIKEGKR